jgi:hypothetical protein
MLNTLYATNQPSMLLSRPPYPHRSEVGALEREHAVKVEVLCVLILLNIGVLIPLYMCPHRSEIGAVETEHAVKVMLITKPLSY